MSPLWRDEVGIYLSPWRVLLVRLKRGWRPQRIAEQVMPLQPTVDHDWRPALNALDTALEAREWHGAAARIVISDHWVRYAALPSLPGLKTVTEKLNHAAHTFTDIYGEVVNEWKIVLSEAAPAPNQVGCALPIALAEKLSALLPRNGISLASLQPQLVSSFNRWSPKLPPAGAWFITIEEGSLAAARLVPHGWDRVYSIRIGPNWQIELRRLQKFGQLATTKPDEGEVFIDAPMAMRTTPQPYAGALRWLDDDSTIKITTAHQLHYLRRTCPCHALS